MKLSKKQRTTLFQLMIGTLLVVLSCRVFAGEITPEAMSPLMELLNLFLAPDVALKWGSLIGAFCYLVTQILPWVPQRYIDKLPTKVSEIIQRIAGNYRETKNELSERDTDITQ